MKSVQAAVCTAGELVLERPEAADHEIFGSQVVGSGSRV